MKHRLPPVIAAVLLLLSPLVAEDAQREGQLLDQPVRTVNARVITLGDVGERTQERIDLARLRNPGIQITPDMLRSLQDESLEDLTDEVLLLQAADRMQVQVDEKRIRSEVLFQVDQRQIAGHIGKVANTVERRIEQERMQRVLGQFLYLGGDVSPEDVLEAYRQRPERWQRPGRANVRQIVLRVAGREEIAQVRERLFAIYRRIQTVPDAAIRDLISDEDLDRLLDSQEAGRGPGSQFAFLLEKAKALDTLEVEDISPEGRGLREIAASVITEAQRLLHRAAIEERMEQWLAELSAMDSREQQRERFAELARRHSQGEGAEDGGSLGWVERGSLPQERDAAVFASEGEGVIVGPVWTGDVAAILLVAAVEEGRRLSFEEVSAEIEAELMEAHRDKIRQRLLDQLRARAQIVDHPIE